MKFANPGAKLKTVAKVFFWIMIIGGFIICIKIAAPYFSSEYLAATMGSTVAFYCVLGYATFVFLSWTTTLAIYAFGQAVENSESLPRIRDLLSNTNGVKNNSGTTQNYGTTKSNNGTTQPLPTNNSQDFREKFGL
ncbi:MAG: hypothetical protein IJT18_05115 [Oscillospiraceae bacterium]|nr:hypothetical protein [Oscillospiraceae bacterium]